MSIFGHSEGGSESGDPDGRRDAEAAALRQRDEQGDAQAAFELGELLVARGDLDDAEAAYQRADERGHPTAAAMVGVFKERRGETSGALDAYRRADEHGDPLGAFKLGMLLSQAGDWDAAREAWKRADERGYDEAQSPAAATIAHPGPAGSRRWSAVGGASTAVFANPVLVGAVSVLAVIIAVFLAYNANQGLPFVPTKELKVDISDGSNMVAGNDVREGGFRIGLVSDLKPIQLSNGQVGAQLTLKLDQNNARVPVDSTAAIRPRSVLGLKYVDLIKGTSKKVIPDGGTLPISRTSVPVQFDDIFKAFDTKTRLAIQQNLAGFGDTFTGRGSAINDTIQKLPELLTHLEPVARTLSDPATGLTRFFTSLNRFMGTVAPLAQVNARLFTDMATTFEAFVRDPNAYEQTIAKSPSTLDVSTDSLKTQQPFLVDLTTFGNNLTPAAGELNAALPDIVPAIEVGTTTLRRTPSLNANLQRLMAALKNLALAPGTNVALNGLVSTVTTLNPMIRYLGPYVTVCNDWNYWWTYIAEHFSQQTNFGYAQRALLNFTNATQPNSVGSANATQPVNGGGSDLNPQGGNEFLHQQGYGAAIDNQGNADCETGQRGFPKKLNYFDPQGRSLALDSHTPGNQGPTFAGRAHVPAGETFTRAPQTGPQLAPIPTNP